MRYRTEAEIFFLSFGKEISASSTLVTELDIYPQPNMLDFVADRAAVFHAIHSVSHHSIRANKGMVFARFVWKDVLTSGVCRSFCL
jgi:hypothetical protein